uniref:Uncharacterized protein n=1 Tax=Chromera velia CCMP2878 TaxID=1169474 RepID=A0A0G4H4D2_9ALVE|mmetsp:Transcript_49537/g.97528  ORF Transcript_49537/g.97528 Transcript_49537/m.97528 type:complete len:258 (+) Transcript_49537:209-982(+)|eukprot:Cvel_24649.t1-p1 / transcript=Cvel_24649.t1 / gene=Cvel_24649 / organism=Chromera_velia_CCMP2878 / gene_product=hypothetical protein / transcript_product=hypothetical protein / location=Cvel_scaffold2693:3094-6029(-) / protein_length=257 / sequence_SO=supercontig / SO=protein_coding / is_pseudo=false
MGNAFGSDTIPVILTFIDVHNARAKDTYYFCNVSNGDASTKVIGRSQTLSVEVSNFTVLTLTVYECPEYVFTPELSRAVGVLRIPVSRLAERYSSGLFHQWFNLDVASDPRAGAGDGDLVVQQFEKAYGEATNDVYGAKICLSLIASSFEVKAGSRQACNIFVGEDVKQDAGPDVKALIASHKQQAEYINALHEELRRLQGPSYRPVEMGVAAALSGAPPGASVGGVPPAGVASSGAAVSMMGPGIASASMSRPVPN